MVEHDMSTRLDLTPWLAGVFVLPEHRGRGVGERLVAHAMSWAAAQRVETLHLYTRDAVALYQKLGWLESGREFYEGREVQLMVFHPGRADRREREARAGLMVSFLSTPPLSSTCTLSPSCSA